MPDHASNTRRRTRSGLYGDTLQAKVADELVTQGLFTLISSVVILSLALARPAQLILNNICEGYSVRVRYLTDSTRSRPCLMALPQANQDTAVESLLRSQLKGRGFFIRRGGLY